MTHIPQFSGTLTGLDTVQTKESKRDKIRHELRQLGVKDALHKKDGDTRRTSDGDSYTLDLRRKDGCSGAPQYFLAGAKGRGGEFSIQLPRLKYYDNGKGFKKFCQDAISLGQTLSLAATKPSQYISSALIQDAKSLTRYKALRDVFDDKDVQASLKKLENKGITVKVESEHLVSITDSKGETFEDLPADKNHAASTLRELIREKAGTTATARPTPRPPASIISSDDEEDDLSSNGDDDTPQELLNNVNEKLGKIYSSVDGRHPKNKFATTLEEQFRVLNPVINGSYVLSPADQRTLKALEAKKNKLKLNPEATSILSQYRRYANRYQGAPVDLVGSRADLEDIRALQDNILHYSRPFQEWQKELTAFVNRLQRHIPAIDATRLNADAFALEDDADSESLSYVDSEYGIDSELDPAEELTIDPAQMLQDIKDIKGPALLRTLDKYRQLKTDLAEYPPKGGADDSGKQAIDALVERFDKWDDEHKDGAIKTLNNLPDMIVSLKNMKDNTQPYEYNSALAYAHEETIASQEEVAQFTDEMKKELSSLYKRFGKEDKLLSLYHPDGKDYGVLDVSAPYPTYESDLPESQRQGVSEHTKLRHLEHLRASEQSRFSQNIQDKNIEKLRESRKKSAKDLQQEREEALAFDNSWATWFATPFRLLWNLNPFAISDSYKDKYKTLDWD